MIEQRYVLIIRRGSSQQVVPGQCFEEAAKTVAALFEEGYREVELWVGEYRKARQEEVLELVNRATELVRVE